MSTVLATIADHIGKLLGGKPRPHTMPQGTYYTIKNLAFGIGGTHLVIMRYQPSGETNHAARLATIINPALLRLFKTYNPRFIVADIDLVDPGSIDTIDKTIKKYQRNERRNEARRKKKA